MFAARPELALTPVRVLRDISMNLLVQSAENKEWVRIAEPRLLNALGLRSNHTRPMKQDTKTGRRGVLTLRPATFLWASFPLGLFRFLWSPSTPLAGAIILAVAATAPIFAAGHRLPPALALPVVFGIMALVAWAGSSLFGSGGQVRMTRLEAVRRFSSPVSSKSIYDPETGFCADWYFMLRVEEELARTKRSGQSLGLLLVEPRTELGATIRNHLLLSLEGTFRTADLIGRLADSRFAVLLPDSHDDGTRSARERLLQLVGSANIRIESIVCPHGGTDWRTFLADESADSRFPSSEPIWTRDQPSAFDQDSGCA